MGVEPSQELKLALEDEIPRLYAMGDCVGPRRIFEATWEAYRLARLILEIFIIERKRIC